MKTLSIKLPFILLRKSKTEQKQLNWYLNRISAMSLPEIVYRFSNIRQIRQERKAIHRNQSIDPVFISKETWFAENPLGKWFAKNQAATAIQLNYSSGVSTTISSADRILNHQLELFGKPISLGETIDWHRDPITGNWWPKQFWADLNYREAYQNGGIKWLWEINRHHHILTLAKAFFLTNTEKYAGEAISQLISWIDQNPVKVGINWTSSLELSIRIINWIWALSFLENSSSLTEEVFHKITSAISNQAEYIHKHLSFYSSANNHLIGEAAGLAMAGMAFPRLPQAMSWETTGLSILTTEVGKQLNPDGSSPEQALHYLLNVMDWYFSVMQFANLNNTQISKIWTERLHQSAVFLRMMMDEKGQIPSIGDSDDAWVLRLDDRPEVNNHVSVLSTAAAWFKDPALIMDHREWDEKSWWLLGEEGRMIFEWLKNSPLTATNNPSVVFPSGGYCVLQSNRTKVIFDCGPLGYLSTAAHGHADALSIWITKQGFPVLIDSGTYAYQEGGAWRRYFRSTAAHNTLRIDCTDQSEMMGDFLWGKKAQARLVYWNTNSEFDIAIAEQNGYQKFGIISRRSLLFIKPDILFIYDQVIGKGSHFIEQFWHLSPDAKVEVRGQNAAISINNLHVNLNALDTALVSLSMVKGQENPVQGWVSPAYGIKTPAPVLIYSGQCSLPVSITTAFSFGNYTQFELEDAKKKLIRYVSEVEK